MTERFCRRVLRGALHALVMLAAAWLAALPRPGAAQGTRVEAVEVALVARDAAVVPGRPLQVALRIRHDPHWHSYWRNPGDSGLPTRLDWRLPAGWQAGEIRWPAPQRVLIGPLANHVYEDEVLLPVILAVPAQAAGTVTLQVQAQWLMCRDVCIPGEASLSLSLPVQAAGEPPASAQRAAIDATLAGLPTAPLPAQALAAQGRLSLRFASAAGLSRAEFFPYEEGRLQAAAPQRLSRLPDGSHRLDIPLAEPAPGEALALSATPRALGVIRLDDRVSEVLAVAAAGPMPAGEPVSEAVGRQLLPAGGRAAVSGALSGPAGSGSLPGPAAPGALPTAPPGSLWLALLFGALGGLILNLMPCVFPVVGLKVMGFVGHGPAQARRAAIAFAVGVLASFLGLAGLLLALRAAGEAVGWGFQLQSPMFVALLGLLFVAIALNFAGLFEVGMSLTRLGGVEAAITAGSPARPGGGLPGAFGSGVLAVLVATPCTAPFMGSALGFTLGEPAPVVLAVFAAIAAGMALPYLVLGFAPALIARLPRPGRWMESLRQFMAFPMLASAAWLAWVLGQQAGIDAVFGLAIGAVLLALAGWILGRFVQPAVGGGRPLAAALALGLALVGVWVALQPLPVSPSAAGAGTAASGAAAAVTADAASATPGAAPATEWQPWSEARVAQAVAQGQPVFIDFTAAWCVSCQANKRLALERDAVREAFARAGVLRLRADWTRQDPAITAALARHGRNGVPLYLLHRPGQAQPLVLPEILTPGLLLEALGSLR
ncbi:MAG: thioredoxin family protein [Burkholderiales bacterium]